MEKLAIKYKNLCNALNRLDEAVVDFKKLQTDLNNAYEIRLYRSFRDSMIQRFEFCVDLFWKYLKIVLEVELKNASEFNSPKSVTKSEKLIF